MFGNRPTGRDDPRTERAAARDKLGRPLRSLRISVTDRCNLRCQYCMPEREYSWLPRESLLRFEEIETILRAFVVLGVTDVRLTGGEPLLRRDLPELVERIARTPGVADLSLTTNGVLLREFVVALRQAGLNRVTVSLDTLRASTYRSLAGVDQLAATLDGLAALRNAGFTGTKLNTVVIRGVNDDEVGDLFDFACSMDAEPRFIEYMDVGGATRWTREHVVSREEILEHVARRHGPIEALQEHSSAPAQRFRTCDGTTFGVIASTTQPFCRTCDRARLTADGVFYTCLYAERGENLRDALRGRESSAAAIAERIADAWRRREDRGAEVRLSAAQRGPWRSLPQLRSDVHLEMHTRGG